ncbi:MAG: Na+/H+ antiporter NhaA [Chloroflexi bacterium]|nr:Na+/H+ antiporter NhaA [Chloroflexota bacterium]
MAFTSHDLAARRARFEQFVRPVQDFIQTETSGGMVLLGAALAALIWANSPWSAFYHDLLEQKVTVDLGVYTLSKSLHAVINDGAMTVFFFLVGLEIKREVTLGELASRRRVIVPLLGALGGIIAPALIFVAITRDPELAKGWGIPIATDIAFALGVLAMLGPRISNGLKALLLAIAIVDDIGAIIVIAVFYTETVSWAPMGIALSMLLAAWVAQQWGIWWIPLYVLFGVIAWAAVLESGIHPTIVGVAFGLMTPWRAWYRSEGFSDLAQRMIERFRSSEQAHDPEEAHELRTDALLTLRAISVHSVAPLDRLEHELHPVVAFGIVPLFALANAGVTLSPETVNDALGSALTWGVAIGLVLGKPVGITAGIWLAVRAGAQLPLGVRWRSVFGLGVLGGIGFTVSLFITELSFADATPINDAKFGILVASLVAGLGGYALLWATEAPPAAAD